jgi:hypothetical protein
MGVDLCFLMEGGVVVNGEWAWVIAVEGGKAHCGRGLAWLAALVCVTRPLTRSRDVSASPSESGLVEGCCCLGREELLRFRSERRSLLQLLCA